LINDFEDTYPKFNQLAKAVAEFRTYIVRNGRFLPNDDERWHYGEAIATGFVESRVNVAMSKRFREKQHMQGSRKSSGQCGPPVFRPLDHHGQRGFAAQGPHRVIQLMATRTAV
jgi:hypothetical protein